MVFVMNNKFADGFSGFIIEFEPGHYLFRKLCAERRMTVIMGGFIFVKTLAKRLGDIMEKSRKAKNGFWRNVFQNRGSMLKNIEVMAKMVLVKTFEHRKFRNEHR